MRLREGPIKVEGKHILATSSVVNGTLKSFTEDVMLKKKTHFLQLKFLRAFLTLKYSFKYFSGKNLSSQNFKLQ